MITHISNDKGKASIKYSAHTHVYVAYMYEKKESTIEIYFVWFEI